MGSEGKKKKDHQTSSSSSSSSIKNNPSSSDNKPKNLVYSLLSSLFIMIGVVSSLICAYFVLKSFLPKTAGSHASVSQSNTKLSAQHSHSQPTAVERTSLLWTHQPDPTLQKYHILPNWGTFRPGYYFGMKTSTAGMAQSATGIMWTDSHRSKFRHDTNQGELTKFEWIEHDGTHYGKQILIDSSLGLNANTTFVIPKSNEDSSSTWIQHISMKSTIQKSSSDNPSSLLFYFGGECADESTRGLCLDQVAMSNIEVNLIESSDFTNIQVTGENKLNGRFRMDIIMTNAVENTISYALISDADIKIGSERLKTDFQTCRNSGKARASSCGLYDTYGELSKSIEEGSSFISIQANFVQSVDLVISFREHLKDNDSPRVTAADIRSSLPTLIECYSQSFQQRFQSLASTIDLSAFSNDHIKSVQTALSSLLGGVGYFEGVPTIEFEVKAELDMKNYTLLQTQTKDSKAARTSLMTGTPSRTVFPRGFLWDEGFHQMVISHWDADITMRVLSDWLNAMYLSPKPSLMQNHNDEEELIGWIPREMILGDDATRRVPSEFVTQRVTIANPPTFLLVLESLLNRIDVNHPNYQSSLTQEQKGRILAFVHDLFPRLHYWIQWFAFTQQGELQSSFRWRGRSTSDSKVIPNTLASGLDDYPRANIPTFEERHVDMHCWMMKAYEIMSSIEKALSKSDIEIGEKQRALMTKTNYYQLHQKVSSKLDEYHWSEQFKGYFDFGVNNESAIFVKEVLFRCGNRADNTAIDGYIPIELLQRKADGICPQSHPQPMYPLGDGNGGYLMRERVVAEGFQLDFVPRVGYVSIFPLLLKSIPSDSPKLAATLDMVENRKLLWTSYGLRSIATTDIYYLRRNAPGDAPYWRGPIWININYLALSALNHYSKVSGPYQERAAKLYQKLRGNLLRNILNEHKKTGFFWEQYDDQNGQGIRGHPFTGWTAVVVNIFLEKY